jgi:hypothetical protein
MDSYVVRIYRRDGKKSRILIGTVEAAGTGRKLAFSNTEELWAILRRRKGQDPCAPTAPGRRLRKEGMSGTASTGLEESVEGVRKI